MTPPPTDHSRRAFLRDGSLVLLGAATACHALGQPIRAAIETTRVARIGLVTDLHYADKPSAKTRHYRETPAKLEAAAARFAADKPDVVVELGDLIDSAGSLDEEKRYLTQIERQMRQLPGKKYYVLGNHCVERLTKEEFLGGVGQEKSHFAFDAGGVRGIVLDACFRSDGEPYGRLNSDWKDANIPESQLDWLRHMLAGPGKFIVFAHQRLDVDNHYAVKNAAAVRAVLETSGRVLAVFQGHNHVNAHSHINGIHYCTLAAMIEGTGAENNAFAVADVYDDDSIQVSGFLKQSSYRWS